MDPETSLPPGSLDALGLPQGRWAGEALKAQTLTLFLKSENACFFLTTPRLAKAEVFLFSDCLE